MTVVVDKWSLYRSGLTLTQVLQYLHSGRGDNTPNIRYHGLGEDLVDESMITNKPETIAVLFKMSKQDQGCALCNNICAVTTVANC